jgi:NAD(P)-dependent dehydrogenase (short-subunit alcohol dehydrogenase family)
MIPARRPGLDVVEPLLQGKVAVVYGGAGSIGGAIARTFAREGAQVHLAGRTGATLQAVAAEIGAAGAAVVDARDVDAVERHQRDVVAAAGRIDVCVNATGFPDNQGTPLREMALADALETVQSAFTAAFVTTTAAARQMERAGGGVILTLSTSATGLSGRERRYHRTGAFGVACASIEELTRSLAGELGPLGVRVVCLRPDALPETWGSDAPADVAAYMTAGTMLDRMPTLAQVADAAAFAASDRAGAITGTILNLTCGSEPG